jgi:hypothetical protein
MRVPIIFWIPSLSINRVPNRLIRIDLSDYFFVLSSLFTGFLLIMADRIVCVGKKFNPDINLVVT